jgi:ferredoxin
VAPSTTGTHLVFGKLRKELSIDSVCVNQEPGMRKEKPMTKRPVIDADECLACGTCTEICPEVFDMDDD